MTWETKAGSLTNADELGLSLLNLWRLLGDPDGDLCLRLPKLPQTSQDDPEGGAASTGFPASVITGDFELDS